MKKEVIKSNNAPAPKGAYSQGIKVGDLVFVSGQAAIDVDTGEFLAPGDIVKQTDIIMKNIKAILEAAGSSLENVVKTTVFIDDIGKFKDFNNVYEKFFKINPPARSTVEVGNFFEGMCIEIEAIAVIGK